MSLLGVDLSHHQEDVRRVDFPAMRKAGYSFAILKATEGATFVDPAFAAMRARARAAGMVVGSYHFARAGSALAEANHFASVVGSLNRGELVVLDWEVSYGDPPGWCLVWLNAIRDRMGVKPLIYMNSSARDGSDWSGVVRGDYGLWLAKYDFNLNPPDSGQWPTAAMKQFSDRANVAGVATPADANVFFGDAAALARYGYTPAPTPPPPPIPENDDMRLNAYRVTGTAEVRAAGPGVWWHVPNTETLQGMQRNGTLGPVVDVSQDEFDAARRVWLSAVVTTPLDSISDPRGDWGMIDRIPAIDAMTQKLPPILDAVNTILDRVPEPPAPPTE